MWPFRKKTDDYERYEADWPDDYGYEMPMDSGYASLPVSEEERERVSLFRRMQGRMRIIFMVLTGYLLFVGIGVAVTYNYPVKTPFGSPLQIGVQNWEQRQTYYSIHSEYATVAGLWSQDNQVSQQLAVSANAQNPSYVPEEMAYSQLADTLATQIRYTSTMSVDPNYQAYVEQLLTLEKDMQQFNQLMNAALVNQDTTALSQARTLEKQIQEESDQLNTNINGIAEILHIS